MRTWVIVAVLILIIGNSAPASAADSAGQYMIGGGVGSLQCVQLTNDMAEARAMGGQTTIAGANKLNIWNQYVVGFQTGYNDAAPGVRDIFARFGSSPSNEVLARIEPWCRQHPLELFGTALIKFVETLRAKDK